MRGLLKLPPNRIVFPSWLGSVGLLAALVLIVSCGGRRAVKRTDASKRKGPVQIQEVRPTSPLATHARKDGDLAIFTAHPFAGNTRVQYTIIDGQIYFDRDLVETTEDALAFDAPTPDPPPAGIAGREGDRQQALEDDLKDHWHSRSHKVERLRLIHRLLQFAEKKETRVTLLSGDVHVGAVGVIESQRAGSMNNHANVIHQLTSSGIVHPAPPPLLSYALQFLR